MKILYIHTKIGKDYNEYKSVRNEGKQVIKTERREKM